MGHARELIAPRRHDVAERAQEDPALITTIERAEARHLVLPTGIDPFVLPSSQPIPTDLSALLIRVVDDDGVTGYSLLWAEREQQLALFESGLRYLAELVEGHRLDENPVSPTPRRAHPMPCGPASRPTPP